MKPRIEALREEGYRAAKTGKHCPEKYSNTIDRYHWMIGFQSYKEKKNGNTRQRNNGMVGRPR